MKCVRHAGCALGVGVGFVEAHPDGLHPRCRLGVRCPLVVRPGRELAQLVAVVECLVAHVPTLSGPGDVTTGSWPVRSDWRRGSRPVDRVRCGVAGSGAAEHGARFVVRCTARCAVRGSGRWRWLGAWSWRGTGRASSHGSDDPARCADTRNRHAERTRRGAVPCSRPWGSPGAARCGVRGPGRWRWFGAWSWRGMGRASSHESGDPARCGCVALSTSSHPEWKRARSLRHCTVRVSAEPALHDEPRTVRFRCRVSRSRPAGGSRAARRGRPGSRRGRLRRRRSGTTGPTARRR